METINEAGEIVPAISSYDLSPVYSLEAASKRKQELAQYVEAALERDIDYGVIPGTGNKPVLLKPGAEKLVSIFGLSIKFDVVESVQDWTGNDHNGEPFFSFWYRCMAMKGDRYICDADGSCNSWEKKYRYRAGERVCPNCGQPAIIKGKEQYGGGWVCFDKKGGCKAKFRDGDPSIEGQDTSKGLNVDIAEQVNTIQKMAQKRALIAVTLLAVNASMFFTQDIEEMANGVSSPAVGQSLNPTTEEYRDEQPPQNRPPRPNDPTPDELKCVSCGREMTRGQHALSMRNFGVPLCPDCQKARRNGEASSAKADAAPASGGKSGETPKPQSESVSVSNSGRMPEVQAEVQADLMLERTKTLTAMRNTTPEIMAELAAYMTEMTGGTNINHTSMANLVKLNARMKELIDAADPWPAKTTEARSFDIEAVGGDKEPCDVCGEHKFSNLMKQIDGRAVCPECRIPASATIPAHMEAVGAS